MSEYNGIMVFGEHDGDQTLKNVSFELISKAVEISDITGEKVVSVCFCDSSDINEMAKFGAQEIVVIKRKNRSVLDIEADTSSAVQIIEKYRPSKVLFGATDLGRILAPKVAARLKCGRTADCTEFSINEKGKLVQIRPALGGNILAHIVSPDTYPQMASVRPSVFKTKERVVPFKKVYFTPDEEVLPEISVENISKVEDPVEVKIEDASRVISVGVGVKQKTLKKVFKFADIIGASVSCSRKVVEAGWLPHSVQVGQSGKTISPDLYIALGISGASQHLAGMKTSDKIIAVNNDPDADIFSVAHKGFVTDVEKWLDMALEQAEELIND